jgi:SAM-dependent methyltransferase
MRIRELQSSMEEFLFVAQAHREGVFDELHKRPDTATGMARRMKYDGRAARVLLDGLVEMGYLKKLKDRYSVPAAIARRLVERKGPLYEGDFLQFLYYLNNPWRTLRHVLKKGVPDKSSYEDFNMDDFIRGMDSPWKKKLTPEIVSICLKARPGARVAADIGGAPGTMARGFAKRGLRTIVYDLPVSMKVTKRELSKVKNIVVAEGDATKALPAGPYDIAFLGNLCHGQSPADNARIMRMCYERLAPGGIVVVFDNFRGKNPGVAVIALHMITQSPAGDIYTAEQYKRWLKDAGFVRPHFEELSDPAWSLLIAYKKQNEL